MSDHLNPPPTGSWDEVIRHLRAAHELMARMDLDDPFQEQSLGDIFKRQIEQMIGTVHQHYARIYWEIATRPADILLRDDGTIEVLTEDPVIRDAYEDATWD